MRRILAIVCIFILLLFTGMPMFTSNLLCNQIEVYADEPPNISDNEKIRAAITVFLNSKGAYLSSNGLTMNVVMGCMQENIDHFYPAYALTIGQAYDAAALVLDIGVSTSPLTVVLKAGAVRFFNAFLQWLIDEGKITNTPSGSDGLYDGFLIGDSLFYICNGQWGNRYNYANNTMMNCYVGNLLSVGTPVNGCTSEFLLQQFMNSNNNASFDEYQAVDYGTVYVPCQYSANITQNIRLERQNQNSLYPSSYSPMLTLSNNLAIIYCNRDSKVRGNTAWIHNRYYPNNYYYGFVHYDYTAGKYLVSYLGYVTRDDSTGQLVNPANINFNKDDFDPSPTTPPTGSDGLSYQPRQSGTGNTYNTYNDYYQDWHEGDTYIYNPGSGGGGSGGDDPGTGGDDPTPGGTTPPWDGSDPGTPAGTLTPVEGGGYNFNLPDLGLPDLNIDWSINGLKEKFPFSIPWDLMAFFAVMNAEPETPEIQATIPLGLWEWEIDWDLHAFDNVARILRNMELIGFCIGLILITRSIIKG